jgi:UDP-glucose 4-epimerase
MKTVLISGANGYIGRHLVKMLKSNNYNVITATRHLGGDLIMDFSNPLRVSRMDYSNIDVMIHMVSPNEELYKHDPYQALTENTVGIHAALDFCKNNNIRDFIYGSSFHIFGKQSGILNEDTSATPYNDYGLAHYTAEQTVHMFNRTNQVNAWVIRPSNIFGIPESIEEFKRWNLIPFAFCKEAVENGKITLFTSGSQIRNFVGVSDVCEKLLWIIENRPIYRIMHAYGNDTMSVLNYAYLVQKVALDRFNIPVQIIRPNGEEEVVSFQFTSLYNCPELSPKEDLETFVCEMLKELLNRSSEREK